MSSLRVTTNFKDSNGVDLGDELITKDYLMSVYPEIGQQIGIPPELWTWGGGSNGRLGNNSTTNVSTPITTSAGGTNWKQVSTETFHTAAIKTDGTLWTWGSGGSGRLGNSVTTNVSTPITTFAGGTNWKQVDCSFDRTAAIKTDGTLWNWGNAEEGKLGNAIAAGIRSTPVTTFAGGTNWKQVSCGQNHTAAIKTDGTLWSWGSANNGTLGNGVTIATISTPVTTFAGGTNWKQVNCGATHTAAIKTDGTLWTWGAGSSGRLGNAATTASVSTPVTTFAGGTNWKQVSAGGDHTAAIKTDGTLWTWGDGSNGQLGNATVTVTNSTPVTTFAGGNNWKQVSASSDYTTAIKTDGTLWTWGLGSNGQLGNGVTTGNISTPITTFAGGTNWKQVSAGNASHTAAIKSVDFASF
jgi:alpha-tubulin suppressor-like RCC1 family protein